MKMFGDDNAVTVTIESVLLFSITVMLLGMVMLSFQSINNQASETVMREQYGSVGNDIASKILDLDIEIKASLSEGSVVNIENILNLRPTIANKPYSIEIGQGKVIVSSVGSPSVTVEVPFDPDLNVVSGSKIYSSQGEYIIMYDPNGQILFKNGGVDATIDDEWPIISITGPTENEINGTVVVQVNVTDNVEISKVEYFINGKYITTSKSDPFSWTWDTIDYYGVYTITAIAYDRVGHDSFDTRTYSIDNGVDNEKPTIEVIYPDDSLSTKFNPPPIKVILRDNTFIDVSSIELILDKGEEVEKDITANLTITNTTRKKYTVEYTSSDKMSNATHYLYIFVRDEYYGDQIDLNNNESLTWSFTVDDISDEVNPTVSIDSPLNEQQLVEGEITVQFKVSDADSGIDYITLNVTDGNNTYFKRENVSTYPDILHDHSGSWGMSQEYELYEIYSYNLTAYDRAGNSKSYVVSDLQYRQSQAEDLIIGTNDVDSDSTLIVFPIKSQKPVLTITGMDITFSTSIKLKKIYIDGTPAYANPNSLSPVSVTGDKTVSVSEMYVTLEFVGDITSNPVVTIHFSDGTSITETIIRQ